VDERDIISLELDRDTASDVADLLRSKRDALNQEITRIQAELEALSQKAMHLGFQLEKISGKSIVVDAMAPTVGKQPRVIPKRINGYKTSFTVWEKVQYVLRKEIEPITKRQIVERIEAFEPGVSSLAGKKRRQFGVAVSNILSTKLDKGLKRFSVDGEENKYLLTILGNE
jgi:hypothetical protein